MNVLISSAGRRTSLTRAFMEAVGNTGKVIAVDADVLAPALAVAAEGATAPRLDDPRFVDAILRLCDEHDIRLIVPTIDTELPVYATHRDRFEERGIKPLVSGLDLIEVTSSKRRTEEVFGSRGVMTPRSWPISEIGDGADLPDRVFVKPDRGSASAHTHDLSRRDLQYVLGTVPDPIVQEKIDAIELTVDALLDLEGTPIHVVPRIRLKTIGGESVQGVTMPDEPVREWLLQVLGVVGDLGGWGPMTIQMFLTTPAPTLVEVNPRFGGGFPLAYEAGARYPQWLLQMLKGEVVRPRLGEYRRGLFMTRALMEYFLDGGWGG